MKSNGSVYVSVVIAVLVGYFTYQWWFNPNRVIKRRLGELAATLTVPATDAEVGRVTRAARLRHFFTEEVHVTVGTARPSLTSRDAIIGAVTAWTPPPGGVNVDFVDLQVNVESASTARVYLTVEVTSHDARTGEATFDSRDATVVLVREGDDWVISEATVKDPPKTP